MSAAPPSSPWSVLPALLAEIAEVVADATGDDQAGVRAALAVAKVRGGQRVRILPVFSDNGWLIDAVGETAARIIVGLYTSEDMGEQIDIPMGPTRGYKAQRQNRRRIIEAGLASEMPVDEIAREAEVTRRYVFWLKARLKEDKPDTRQLGLFG